jgi:hypothetical protein
MSITAAAMHTTAPIADRLLVHHAARADFVRLDLSTRACFFMRIDRLTGISCPPWTASRKPSTGWQAMGRRL